MDHAILYSSIGLNDKEVLISRLKYGENILTKRKRKNFFRQYLSSFDDPIIRILLAALALNIIFLFGNSNIIESVGIALTVFISTFISTLSQYSSESAFLELQRTASVVKNRVKRNGKIITIAEKEVVNGDIVLIETGEKVPGDGRIIEGKITVNQSALNGESNDKEKIPSENNNKDLMSNNMLFKGSIVTSGKGIMVVENVGDNTFYGSIAHDLQEKAPDSPLKEKLTKLAKTLSKFGYLAGFLVAMAYLFNVFFLDNSMNLSKVWADICNYKVLLPNLIKALTMAIAVVVVAVPEGLPMMIAIVLSSNMIKMVKDKVIVRKPIGIEASGGINILFTDKTGTITKGNLNVVKYILGDGHGFNEIKNLNEKVAKILTCSAHFNTGSSITDWKIVGGNATERALLESAKFEPIDENEYKIIKESPFDSDKKYSFVTLEKNNKNFTLIKGAPEKILKNCKKYIDKNGILNNFDIKYIENIQRRMARKSIRVLCVAITDNNFNSGLPEDMIFVSLIGIRDEIRQEVPNAIEEMNKAGVHTIMITGDNEDTAVSVAKEVGIMNKGDISISGNELLSLSDEKIKNILPKLSVVARALPTDKSRLVRIAQSEGLVTGMTGDGINDAPALKKADVGFSMGNGTEVAKEASDIVISDNNFASIVKAVRYGRTIFKSIRKFIVFQLTMNLCAVAVSILAPFIGIDMPVTVIQMLWINIIMDTLAGLAFAGEPCLKEYMNELPTKRNTPVLNKNMIVQILTTGIYSVLICMLFLKLPFFRNLYAYNDQPLKFYTVFFNLFVFLGIFNAFNARTERINIFSHIRENKTFIIFIIIVAIVQIILLYIGGKTFRCMPLSFIDLVTSISIASTVIPVDIIRKIIINKLKRK